MAEPGIPVPSRRTLLACTGAACAAVLAGCARGSTSNGAMAREPARPGNSATVPPDWASRAAAGLDQAVLGQPASGKAGLEQAALGPAGLRPARLSQPPSSQPPSSQPPSTARASHPRWP